MELDLDLYVPANAGSVTLSLPANAEPNASINPTLTWNAVGGAPVTSYHVLVSDASSFSDSLVKTTVGSGVTTYPATLGSGTYYWKVGRLERRRHDLEFDVEFYDSCGRLVGSPRYAGQ